MYELEKENLKRFNSYIVKILRPSYIKEFMVDYLRPEKAEQIISEEGISVTSAAEMLMRSLWTLDQDGWFVAFLNTLRAEGYTGLYEAIKEWDFKNIDSMEPFKHLLDRIEQSFTKQIKPTEMINHMKDCLLARECEEIMAISLQKGNIAGAQKFTECLKRSDKSNWYKTLTLALQNCNYMVAYELLDDTENEKAADDSEANEGEATVRFEYREEADVDCLSGNFNGQPGTSNSSSLAESRARRKLRKYQEELAVPAFNGENTIICAPTGCGKTVVALAICENHLKAKHERKPKIVFMATKVDVYEQQYALFRSHFMDGNEEVQVAGLCGDTGDHIPVGMIIQNNDIIVLTPQILVNAIKTREVLSLSLFTLLIFDECHNTTGKHAYNILMTNYLDCKIDKKNGPLPQIVGLTASVGIGSFKNEDEAAHNICQLCANLDVRVISTVKENQEELTSFVNIPEKVFFQVEKRTSDPFISIICRIMSNIEGLARNLYNIDSLSNIQTRDYGTQKYEQWIVDVQKRCKVLQLSDKKEESRVCRALFNYTEHLRKYNDALIINEDARTKDALVYLEAFFDQVRNAGFDETEQKITAFFDAEHKHLVQLSNCEREENPKLKELKYILDEEYRNNDQTRTVLFVRTRALAEALKNWIDENDTLKFLKPGVLIGRGKRSQQTGMTLTSKKGLLDSFKSSDQSKVLIATSVADEGIDIPQCNLVLMYEYVGNVVKMVQVRGRGRAQGSKCILVSSEKARIEKEQLNIFREKIMDKAVNNLQLSREAMLRKIDILQREDKKIRDYINSAPQMPRTSESFELLCSKCKSMMCFSDDLRVLRESHHVVLNKRFFERCITKPHDKPRTYDGFSKKMKMFCKNCKFDWGIVGSYMHINDLPVIKIESFVAKNCVTNRQFCFRKWRDVTFRMKEFDLSEIRPDHLSLMSNLQL
nr:PREDICTED: probable ATP-dependent RNA helicase DDX58 isoform X1 [Lepisosteus oculatus]